MTGARSLAAAPDVIVVGAGVVGAAVARSLSLAGMRVDVIEARLPGGGATAGGMGHVVAMDDSPAQLALTRLSLELLREIAPMLPASCELERTGTLWLAEDDGQHEALADRARVYAACGIDAQVIDARQLADAEPNLRADLAGAMHVPADCVLYPPAFAHALLADAVALGARQVSADVRSLEAGAVITADGSRLEAGAVVNACGVHAPLLMRGLPVVPRRGHLLITDRYPTFCRHQVVESGYMQSAHTMSDASVAFNVQPRQTGQVLIGSSRELVGFDPAINRDVVSRMMRRAIHFMPALERLSVIRTWTAFRPATPDKLPFIGAWPHSSRTWVAAGHEGLGITTALATAHLLTDLMLDRATAIDAAPFSPARAWLALEAACG